MKIRHTLEKDLPRIMEIYDYARKFMTKTGNPNQWGVNNWPPEELIREDIAQDRSYVCINDNNEVIGTFCYFYGKDIDPTYLVISNGQWIGNNEYGVIHRLAGDGSQKGIGAFCINWAFEQCGHIRIDTHTDNKVMQKLATKLGFIQCGIIHVQQDNDPRIAYEKITENRK